MQRLLQGGSLSAGWLPGALVTWVAAARPSLQPGSQSASVHNGGGALPRGCHAKDGVRHLAQRRPLPPLRILRCQQVACVCSQQRLVSPEVGHRGAAALGLQGSERGWSGCKRGLLFREVRCVTQRDGSTTSHLPAYLCALAARVEHGVSDVLPAVASIGGVVDVHSNGGGAVTRGQQHLTLHSSKASHGGGLGTLAGRSGQWLAGAAHPMMPPCTTHNGALLRQLPSRVPRTSRCGLNARPTV